MHFQNLILFLLIFYRNKTISKYKIITKTKNKAKTIATINNIYNVANNVDISLTGEL